MEGFTKEIENDYRYLEYYCKTENVSDKTVFKIIASYDEKYRNNPFHYEHSEGLLSNIGADLKSINILNASIARLLNKTDKKLRDKYYYDLGNTILTKSEIEHCNCLYDINYLVNSGGFLEAKKYFSMVTNNDQNHYHRAITNLTNILKKFGRVYEAINSYNKVLKTDPYFGMALGNKAMTLEYYLRLSPHKSYRVYYNIFQLLEKALLDPTLENIGGRYAVDKFKEMKNSISEYLLKNNYTHKNKVIPKNITKYERFVMNEDLFLNYDLGYYYDNLSVKDNFFPNLIENTKNPKSDVASFISKKTFYTFKIFNQLIEDYTSVRYLFYLNRTIDKTENNVDYIYLYDYSIHSRFHGNLKHIYAILYNCLDKVAHFVKYYFFDNIIDKNENIYFNWLTSPEVKKLIISQNNYQLLALHHLALDFCEGYTYSNLRYIRNKITHSFVIIKNLMIEEETQNNILSEDELIDKVKELFLIVKSAMFYLIVSINCYKKESELYGKLDAVMEKDIYKGIMNDTTY